MELIKINSWGEETVLSNSPEAIKVALLPQNILKMTSKYSYKVSRENSGIQFKCSGKGAMSGKICAVTPDFLTFILIVASPK